MSARRSPLWRCRKEGINRREFLNFAWLASLGFRPSIREASHTFRYARFKEWRIRRSFTIGSILDIPQAAQRRSITRKEALALEH